MAHWTDRAATETLIDWLTRIYDGMDWNIFDAKIEELKANGAGFPGTMVETLYLLRELEKQQCPPQ